MSTHKYRKLVSDVALFAVSNFGSKILVFCLVPLYTGVLSTHDYGVVDTVTSMTGLLIPVLTLLVSEAVLRFAFDEGVDRKQLLSSATILILGSTGFLILLVPCINRLGGEWGLLAGYWPWLIAVYFLTAVNNCFSNYVRGLDKTRLFAISGILYTATLIAANLVFLLVLQLGLEGYLLAVLTAEAVSIGYKIIKGRFLKDILAFSFSTKLFKEMIRYSIPMVPSSIAWWAMQLSDKYIIIGCCGLAASGVYSIAYKIPSILAAASNIFTQAWQISAIKSYNDKDNAEFVSNVYSISNAISVIISTFLIMLAKPMGRILYSGEYFTAWHYVPVLIVAYHFSGLSGILASSYSAEKKTAMLFLSTCAGAVFNIVFNIILIPRHGVITAAYTTMVSFILTWLIRIIHVQSLVKVRVPVVTTGISFLLLITQAIIISQDWKGNYLVSLTILLVQIILYRLELYTILSGAKKTVVSILGRGKKDL